MNLRSALPPAAFDVAASTHDASTAQSAAPAGTHEVFNQAPPLVDTNPYTDDVALREAKLGSTA